MQLSLPSVTLEEKNAANTNAVFFILAYLIAGEIVLLQFSTAMQEINLQSDRAYIGDVEIWAVIHPFHVCTLHSAQTYEISTANDQTEHNCHHVTVLGAFLNCQ